MVVNSFYLKTYDSAQIKITITQIGATALAFAWLIKIVLQGRFPFTKKDVVYVLPFVAFLASGLIVWLHTPFKDWSLEETLRRVFYMIVSIVTIAEMRSTERMTRLWRWLMAAAWVSLGYGLLQYIDLRFFPAQADAIDPFIWRGAFGPRVFSTFGNPNFYGNFLVIMTPIILASVLREKGSVIRPFVVLVTSIALVFVIDKMTLGLFGGFDPSFRFVAWAIIACLLGGFVYACTARIGSNLTLPLFLVLFAILFVNLYSTETKGAWMGFIAAIGVTVLLIFEFFLHFEEHLVDAKKYFFFVIVLASLLGLVLVGMFVAFVLPLLKGVVGQIGFQILWIPTLIAGVISVATILWLLRKPWNLKKVVYGLLVFFIVSTGGGVLQFAKTRLVSVSFRMFTWISTWEMVRTNPILGNGVGTFKIIYPAFRRPQIIVLEGRSNTETDHSEDEYLEIWQDEGIVGFGIFFWMVITALVLGFKQLGWYSTHRAQDGPKAQYDSRAYEVLGFLAAYIGALIHWFVDVSVRFVSSGIFSGFLPGVLVAYARNHEDPLINEVRLPYDAWIRAGLAAFWTVVFLWLGLELVPQDFIQGGDTTSGQIQFWVILLGISLYILIELLERGNKPSKIIPFKEQYGEINPKFFFPRMLLIPLVTMAFLGGMKFAADQFWADVHHNLAIFFSKEAIWMKSPNYDARMMNLPPDIRKKYQETGGALEHYKEVVKKNHAFPMAHYFTGNVYNDWGSQIHGESINARNKGDQEEALRLKAKAQDMWKKSEDAYNDTKRLAPNYVQTHHQVGLLNVKRAEQANVWGEMELSKIYYEDALRNFYLYKMLDPVFPPNYDRIVQILLMQGKINESIDLYKEALFNNEVMAQTIHKWAYKDRIAAISISLAKLYFNQVAQLPNPFHPPTPQVLEAIKYFQKAADNEPTNLEAWKGLGFMLEKTGKSVEAQAAYQQALKLAPNDPDLRKK
jgi:tetratricopeptide (TPR) repeat protein/O-antigen ligase